MREAAFDVVVVGAGPAGSMAARTAALAGARTLVIDRARFPRYKTCGGGLIGLTLANLPADVTLPVRQRVDAASFTVHGRRERWLQADEPLLRLTTRDEFDAALLASASRAGAATLLGVPVTGIREDEDVVELATGDGPVRARCVIGADGSTSRLARHVGASMAQVDLGLEVELEVPDPPRWRRRIHLDWGSAPGSYGWVFPKGDTLTVGVIHRKGEPEVTRSYLEALLRRHGLDRLPRRRSSGHLTRCRAAESPLASGRVLLAGDAAGLLEPWTREGISYAVRSGAAAGRFAARAGTGELSPDEAGEAYRRELTPTLLAEMAAGQAALAVFERHPRAFHEAVTRFPPGWGAFTAITRGRITLADIFAHRSVRAGAWVAGHPTAG